MSNQPAPGVSPRPNPFLDLPVELRLRIYEAHFEDEREIVVPKTPDIWDDFGPLSNKQPPITRVSRQVRAESLPTFYSFCSFDLGDLCSPCLPEVERQITKVTEHNSCKVCHCVGHPCYRDNPCRARSLTMFKCWRWILAVGAHNLAHIRKLVLGFHGNPYFYHKGYQVIVLQDPLTKRLTISQDSFWQDERGARTRRTRGVEPEGNAIIDEISQSLSEDEASRVGLTRASIRKIVHISYERSFTRRRKGQHRRR